MSEVCKIVIAPAAEREIRKMKDKKALKRMAAVIDSLAETPRPTGVEKLKDLPNLWRIRVGGFRLIYAIREGVLVIVLSVKDRKDAYQDLDGLLNRLRAVDVDRLVEEIRASQ